MMLISYDTARFAAPRGDYRVLGDARGAQWYAIRGEVAVDRKPVYENGKAVYDDGKLRTGSVETVRYKQTPARFSEPQKRTTIDEKGNTKPLGMAMSVFEALPGFVKKFMVGDPKRILFSISIPPHSLWPTLCPKPRTRS